MKSSEKRTRNDPRREAARVALIETAETLIAEAGVEAVSSRQIGAAIGSANNNVVSYYFGNKQALIDSIYHYRLPALEARRAELLASVDRDGRSKDLYALMKALWLPLFEQVNGDGRHSYAGFLAGLFRSGLGGTRLTLSEEYPVAIEISRRIKEILPPNDSRFFEGRMQAIFWILVSTLIRIDQDSIPSSCEEAKQDFADALRMATAAFKAPTE